MLFVYDASERLVLPEERKFIEKLCRIEKFSELRNPRKLPTPVAG
jgi:hypothetical protein